VGKIQIDGLWNPALKKICFLCLQQFFVC
jgi:hypothetical protein